MSDVTLTCARCRPKQVEKGQADGMLSARVFLPCRLLTLWLHRIRDSTTDHRGYAGQIAFPILHLWHFGVFNRAKNETLLELWIGGPIVEGGQSHLSGGKPLLPALGDLHSEHHRLGFL